MANCKDCNCELGSRGDNHKYCTRCLSQWYSDRDLDPSNIPNGDFDDDFRGMEE